MNCPGATGPASPVTRKLAGSISEAQLKWAPQSVDRQTYMTVRTPGPSALRFGEEPVWV